MDCPAAAASDLWRALCSGPCPTTSYPPHTLRARYVCVHVWCKACRHSADADLQKLLDEGRGDVPLVRLRYRCSNCQGDMTDFVVMSKDTAVVPWVKRTAARYLEGGAVAAASLLQFVCLHRKCSAHRVTARLGHGKKGHRQGGSNGGGQFLR
jgi:hypothetical protein